MGAYYSRSNERVENVDLSATSYRFPPKSGNYFSSHFIMGDQTFAGTQPESFLFGENSDLNFLPPRPVAFPYPETNKSEPTKLLRSLINLRKDSLKLVKHMEKDSEGDAYAIDFTFDADVKCAVTIYYLAFEDLSSGHAVYTTKESSLTSRSFEFDKGPNQAFGVHGKFHLIQPSQFKETELIYNEHTSQIPVVIHITATEEDYSGHSNITFANIEKLSDGCHAIKLVKQKQMVDGLCYLLHEIYGLESKEETENGEEKGENYDDGEDYDGYDGDNYSDEYVVCVVCLSDARDTLMLPCKHLCVCNSCAASLRRGVNNCPICRVPFHALLQLCAYQRATTTSARSNEQFPGYEKVDLFDALNAFNMGKEYPGSREIVRRVSARARSRSRPTTPKPSQKASAEDRLIRRSSSRFSRSSLGSYKRDRDRPDTPSESVVSFSKTSIRRSKKGSSRSHVIEVEDRSCIVDMKKDSSVDAVEGVEVGVEVGQDNLGMDSVEEETALPRKETEGSGKLEEVDDASPDKPPEAPNPLNVPLPGTPLDRDLDNNTPTREPDAHFDPSSSNIITDGPGNVETLIV